MKNKDTVSLQTSCPDLAEFSAECKDSISPSIMAASKHSCRSLKPFTWRGYWPNISVFSNFFPVRTVTYLSALESREFISQTSSCLKSKSSLRRQGTVHHLRSISVPTIYFPNIYLPAPPRPETVRKTARPSGSLASLPPCAEQEQIWSHVGPEMFCI